MDRARRLFHTFILVGSILVPLPWRAVATPATITFAAAGDHGANSSTAASLNLLDSSGVDFYLAVGDLDYRQTAGPDYGATWCEYVKSHLPTLGPSFPFQIVAGNREETIIEQHAACLPDRLNSTIGPNSIYAAEYYFDYPAAAPLVRVIMISPTLKIQGSTYEYRTGNPHYNFVAGAIDDGRARGIPWTVVGEHINSVGADLTDLLVAKKVDLVIQGHDHSYKRGKQLALNPSTCPTASSTDPDCVVDDGSDGLYSKGRGTITLINGTFGQGSPNGFTKFTVSAQRIDAEFINSSSSFSDAYAIVPNQPPTITSPGNQDHAEQQTVTRPIIASDPEGDPMTFTATGLPPGLGINQNTGSIGGTVAVGAREGSPYTTRVTVTDVNLLARTVQFSWTIRDITPPATPPSLTIVRNTTGAMHLDWPSNSEADFAGYNVARSPTGAPGTFAPLASGITASDFIDETTPPNATSYYQVTAFDRAGNVSAPRGASARRSKIVYVSQSTSTGSDMSMSIPRPAGVANGDLVLAAISVRGTVAILPPLGWTLVSQISPILSMTHQVVYYRIASNEPASYTFSFVGRASAAGIVAAYRGTTDRPSSAAAQANESSSSITAPAITPAAQSAVQVAFFGIAADTAITSPATMIEKSEVMQSSGSLPATMSMTDAVVDALPLPPRVATAGRPAPNIGQVVILSPAP